MIKLLLNLCFTSCLLGLSLVAIAQTEPTRSCKPILELLEAGAAPAEVVRATVDTGMTLSEAAVYAMVCGGEDNRSAIAVAAVELAGSLAQAQSVMYALLATAGRTGPVATAVGKAFNDFASSLPQPSVYEDEYTPTGTAVSPAV